MKKKNKNTRKLPFIDMAKVNHLLRDAAAAIQMLQEKNKNLSEDLRVARARIEVIENDNKIMADKIVARTKECERLSLDKYDAIQRVAFTFLEIGQLKRFVAIWRITAFISMVCAIASLAATTYFICSYMK